MGLSSARAVRCRSEVASVAQPSGLRAQKKCWPHLSVQASPAACLCPKGEVAGGDGPRCGGEQGRDQDPTMPGNPIQRGRDRAASTGCKDCLVSLSAVSTGQTGRGVQCCPLTLNLGLQQVGLSAPNARVLSGDARAMPSARQQPAPACRDILGCGCEGLGSFNPPPGLCTLGLAFEVKAG